MGLQGPPYAVLSPLVADPLAPPGDPESSLFLTCHFVFKGWWKTKSPDWAKLTELILGLKSPPAALSFNWG